MKSSRFTDSQIIAILKQAEGGCPVAELFREHDSYGNDYALSFLCVFILVACELKNIFTY